MENVPNEINLSILERISHKYKLVVSQINRKFHFVSLHNVLWRKDYLKLDFHNNNYYHSDYNHFSNKYLQYIITHRYQQEYNQTELNCKYFWNVTICDLRDKNLSKLPVGL